MPPSSDSDGRSKFVLRRRIMEFLYERFRQFPYAFTELEAIEEACETSSRELNWNLVYLEKSGFLELTKNTDSFPYVAAGAALTARGIDLLEDESEFEGKFPL